MLDGFRLNDESPTLLNQIGAELADVDLTITVSNLVIRPDVEKPAHAQPYWCILTRVISTECKRNNDRFVLGADRSVTEDALGMLNLIRGHVGAKINPTPVKDTKPIEPEEKEAAEAEAESADAADVAGQALAGNA